MNSIQNKFIIIIFFIIAFYTIFLVVSDITSILDTIQKFDLKFTPLILILVVGSWFCLFFKWHLLLKNQGIDIQKKKNMPIYFSSFALSLIPGKMGELVKSQLLKKKFDIPLKTTAPTIFLEQIYMLIGLIVVSLVGVWLFDIGLYIIAIFSISIILILSIIRSKRSFNKIISVLERIKFLNRFTDSLSNSHDIIQKATKKKIFFYATTLSIAYWFIECVIVFLVLLSFGIELEFLLIIPTYLASIILGIVSFLPIGLGVVESSFAGFLTLHGIDISISLTVVIVIRIFTRWIAISFGFVSLKLSGGFKLKDLK